MAMGKRWLEREGPRWVDEQIITQNQYERIQQLYEKSEGRFSAGLLPVLGSLLVGLGVLSFVAANWQTLPETFRILLLCAAMIGSYVSGDRIIQRGKSSLGIAVVGIGLFLFGAGIILIGQMFHMVAYSALSLVIWGAAGAALSYGYRSRYLSLLTLAILTAAQAYSLNNFSTFSYAALALLVLGVGAVAYRCKDSVITALWCLSALFHSFLYIVSSDYAFGWFFLPLLLFYAAGDGMRTPSFRSAMQTVPLGAAFIVHMVLVVFHNEFFRIEHETFNPIPYVYLPVAAALLYLSWHGKRTRRDLRSASDWILFLPFYYLPGGYGWLFALAALFLFALYVLTEGYKTYNERRIRTGTALFLLASMVAYFTLTWDFMDKGLFFLGGGVLLLALSWFLNRNNRQMIQQAPSDRRNNE